MRKLSIFGLVFFGILSLTSMDRVKAQVSSELKTKYRTSLDNYRTSEDQFVIASTQYYTLKTLAAGEEAVRATREVNLSRVDVILTYIEALRSSMDLIPGIELSRKATLVQDLEGLVNSLKGHRARIEIATNRILIENENQFFEANQDTIASICYRALSLIKLGAVQVAFDQLVVTHSDVSTYLSQAPMSETVRSQKQRGSDEVSRIIDEVKTMLAQTLIMYDQNLKNFDSSAFRSIQQSLSQPYNKLTVAKQFVEELTQ